MSVKVQDGKLTCPHCGKRISLSEEKVGEGTIAALEAEIADLKQQLEGGEARKKPDMSSIWDRRPEPAWPVFQKPKGGESTEGGKEQERSELSSAVPFGWATKSDADRPAAKGRDLFGWATKRDLEPAPVKDKDPFGGAMKRETPPPAESRRALERPPVAATASSPAAVDARTATPKAAPDKAPAESPARPYPRATAPAAKPAAAKPAAAKPAAAKPAAAKPAAAKPAAAKPAAAKPAGVKPAAVKPAAKPAAAEPIPRPKPGTTKAAPVKPARPAPTLAEPIPKPAGAAKAPPATAAKGGPCLLDVLDTDPSLNAGQRETVRMIYMRFAPDAKKSVDPARVAKLTVAEVLEKDPNLNPGQIETIRTIFSKFSPKGR